MQRLLLGIPISALRATKQNAECMQLSLLFNFLPQSRIDGSSFRLCVLYDGMAYEPGPASATAAEAPVESMVAWLRGKMACRRQFHDDVIGLPANAGLPAMPELAQIAQPASCCHTSGQLKQQSDEQSAMG